MKYFLILVKGGLIGIANVIPGVSGGTFALVLGIYDRLIGALKSLDLQAARVATTSLLTIYKPESRATLWAEIKRTDMIFLGLLGCGAVAAIKGLAGLLQWLLSDHPMLTLAFFIGLIVPSIAVPAKMIQRRGPVEALACLLGIGLTVFVSMGQVGGGSGQPPFWLVFFGGAVAIAAMLLPGISGSFVLLVIGLYQPTLEHIHHITGESFVFLGIMAAGFIFGVITVSRAMSWLLKNQRSATLAFLIGLIFGSFYVLWPFKDYAPPPTAAVATSAAESSAPAASSSGENKLSIRIATAPNRLPKSASEALWPGVMMLLGLGCAVGLNKFGGEGEDKDKEDKD